MTEATIAELAMDKWPTEFFGPTSGQLVTSLLLLVSGLLVTLGMAWLGARLENKRPDEVPKR